MNSLTELKSSELLEISGGESFAYRVGQAVALLSYYASGVPSIGAARAKIDWFG